ncbi:MAG: hypothetical protein Kow00114_25270 [Kiloniellaceae bacterium]
MPKEKTASTEERRWLEENTAALDAANACVEAHGLPLARLYEEAVLSILRIQKSSPICSCTSAPKRL